MFKFRVAELYTQYMRAAVQNVHIYSSTVIFPLCRRELRYKHHPHLTAHKVCMYATKMNTPDFYSQAFVRTGTTHAGADCQQVWLRGGHRKAQVGGPCGSWRKDYRRGALPFSPANCPSSASRPSVRHGQP